MNKTPFLFLGRRFYKVTRKYLKREKTCESLRKLHVVSKQELDRMCDEYYITMFTRGITLFILCLFLSVCLWIKYAYVDEKIMIERDSYGGNTGQLELETKIGEETTAFSIDVLPVTYEAEQMQSVFERGFEYIDDRYLGNNESADVICTDLNLIDEIKELGLQVTWISDQYSLINGKGEITSEGLDIPALVTLTATLHYQDYSAERAYTVRLIGREKTASEAAVLEIRQYIYDLQVESPNIKSIEIPDMINGYSVRLSKGFNPGFTLLILGVIVVIMIMLKGQSDLNEKTLLRNDALLMQYPSFVEKLTLYMGAGLTIRKALMLIASTKQDIQKNKYKQILYEEIKYTLNEIQSGMPEGDAYYQLGHRLNLPVYMKITSLLSQNLKKGTKDILELLTEEAHRAFQMRKELAKKKGEEAGTKLLLPMMILLGVVIVIVVLPALMSF